MGWLGWVACGAGVGPVERSELAQRAYDPALFDVHAQVCEVPAVDPMPVLAAEVTASELDPDLALAAWTIGDTSGVGDPFPEQTHRLAVPQGGPTRDSLVLVLPGTAQECDQFTTLVDTAASYGFAALCLGYPNQPMVAETCAATDDPTCAEGVRTEVLYGVDASPLVALTPENSVAGRLEVALEVLADTFPADGWDQFLGPDGVAWDRVTAVGFSQGAGHVSLLARDHALERAVLLSGGCDLGADGAWCADPRATPVDRTFSYWHRDEPAAPAIAAFAASLGQDHPVDVDVARPGYACARALTTGQATEQTHGVVAVDGAIAVGEDGAPVDAEVYRWLLLAEQGSPWAT